MAPDPGHILALAAISLVTAAVLAWVNHRFIGLPTTIGVMLIALAMSLGLQLITALGIPLEQPVEQLLIEVDFSETVLDMMLAFLLFAGALHVKLDHLREQKWIITTLATVGVLVSTALVAGMTYVLARAMSMEITFGSCLLFGALISPTDPIAVLGILKSAGVPKSLETKITGESLFNDGIAVVVFSLLVGLVGGGHGESGGHGATGAADVAALLAVEVGGALALGMVCGWLAYRMLSTVDSYQVEVLITLALCTGVYALASSLHSSGPLAVVVAGLLIGNSGRQHAMSERTVEHVDTFWELVDEILNVVLFVLIGMEVLVLTYDGRHVLAGLLVIPVVLLARFAAVGGAVTVLLRRRTFSPHAIKIITWAGLRGGISVALALSLAATTPARDLIVTMTYIVVIFSIVVQGLSVAPLVRATTADERHATV
jgi:CPA1 family monovalent cation:H+ antiporter